MRVKLPAVMARSKTSRKRQPRKNLGGRPRRNDSPKRVTMNLSARSSKLLDRLSMNHPSRGRYVESLIEAAAAVAGAGR